MADPKEMAERLRAFADTLTPSSCSAEQWIAVDQAATLIERLTVEGLAGAIAKAMFGPNAWVTQTNTDVAKAVINHLTTGTEEQNHGL